MGERAKMGWGALLGALVSTGLLYWLASVVDWEAFRARVPPGALRALAIAGSIYVVTLALRALRFSWLFGRVARASVSPFAMFRIVIVNTLFNHLLPLRAGELAFLSLARVLHRVGVIPSTLVLVIARMGDLVGLLLGMSVASFFVDLPAGVRGLLVALALAAIVALFRMGGVVRLARRVLSALAGKLLPTSLGAKAAATLDKVDLASKQVHGRPLAIGNLLLSLAIWLVNTWFFFVVMGILDVEVTYAAAFLGGSGAALLPTLPINAFGALGTLQAGWAAGFVLVGVEPGIASASGFIVHGVILGWTALLGVLLAIPLVLALQSARTAASEARISPPAE